MWALAVAFAKGSNQDKPPKSKGKGKVVADMFDDGDDSDDGDDGDEGEEEEEAEDEDEDEDEDEHTSDGD